MADRTKPPLVPAPFSVRTSDPRGDAGLWARDRPIRVCGAVDGHVLGWFDERVRAAGWPGVRADPTDDSGAADVVITVTASYDGPVPRVEGVDPRLGGGDERHRIDIESGRVEVTALSDEGVFRALTTLADLLEYGDGELPDLELHDGPRWAWRGLSLDVVRHPFTRAEVGRVIDLLARYRANVLHLHLTDAQAWRLPSASRPELTDPARGGSADAFTAEDLTAILDHAERRHVVVVPEIDLPGHAAVVRRAFPELGPEPVHPLLGHVSAGTPGTAAFLDDVYPELAGCAGGGFVHAGGDEPFGMDPGDYRSFLALALPRVRATGKRAVVWQEAMRSGAVGPDDVVQYWIGPGHVFDADDLKEIAPPPLHPMIDDAAAMFAAAPEDLARAIDAGVPVLVSSSDMLYLDRPYADPTHDEAGEERRTRLGMAAYPAHTLEQAYDWSVPTMPELAGAKVAGIEAAVWSESITSFDDLAFLLLPRFAGVASRAWSWRPSSWSDHRERLRAHREAWAREGWGAAYWPAG